MSFMSPEHELMGDMRIASTTMQKARDTLTEVWEGGEAMLTPIKAAELTSILAEMKRSIKVMDAVVLEFADLAARRAPKL